MKDIKEYKIKSNDSYYFIFEIIEDNTTELVIYDDKQKNKLGSLTYSYNSLDTFLDYEIDNLKKETLNEELISKLENFSKKIKTKDNIIYINDILIEEDFRNKGIGSVLFNLFGELLKEDIELGFNDSIYLNACPTDEYSNNSIPLDSLIEFYKSFGFKVFYHQGVNANMFLFNTTDFFKKNSVKIIKNKKTKQNKTFSMKV